MGKIVAVAEAKTKKKKKGRPSLVDLQKRSLLQQQQQQEEEEQQQARKRNPNPSPNSNQAPNFTNSRSRSPASKPDPIPRRVTRRQASQIQKKDEGEVEEAAEDDDDDDDDDEDDEEKKLKLVLRLPRSFHPCSPSSLEGLRDRGDAEASGSAASDDESENGEKPLKKRKIDAVSESKKAAVCNGSAGDAGRCPGFATGKVDVLAPFWASFWDPTLPRVSDLLLQLSLSICLRRGSSGLDLEARLAKIAWHNYGLTHTYIQPGFEANSLHNELVHHYIFQRKFIYRGDVSKIMQCW